MERDMEFWYDQFLGTPPGHSAVTEWHRDEGYWGRNLKDRGITGWIPLRAKRDQSIFVPRSSWR
jgi:phytanoyl-CoA hydroxylase